MKTLKHPSIIRFVFNCLTLSALLLSADICMADLREDAVLAISRLHQSLAARQFPNEMRNLDSTLADAERLREHNDQSSADSYFLLALQKARLLQSMLAPEAPPTNAATDSASHNQDGNEQQPATSSTDNAPETGDSEDTFRSAKLVGGSGAYTVKSGDTIRLVAAKLGVSRSHLIKMNHLDPKSYLKIGQKLVYNNRKIIPQRLREGIVINIPDRTLYFFKQGNLVRSIPVAVGVSTKNDKYDWQTPVGKFKITAKLKDPTWHVPPSIQSEMEDRGKEVITSIQPGPENPLGKFAMKTSIPGILIHSTTKPWSIYSFASHGCIRVYPAQMEEFFNEVKVNTLGEIIYRPVKLAVTETGRIFLEVHNDVYNRTPDLVGDARKLVGKHGLEERIDWEKFEAVVKQKTGIAQDITL